jgi:hypothetical protein
MKRIEASSVMVLGFLGLVLSMPSAWATPAQVVIIRHAEKPPIGNDLNAQGYQRANALPGFFSSNSIVDAFGDPVAIYAMAPSKADGTMRPIETVTPLAQQLGLTIQENYTKNDLQPVVSEIMNDPQYDGRMVVVCWEHTVIPQLAQTFGLTNGPTMWPDNVFDIAWVLHFDGNSAVDGFVMVPENVLPGDSTTVPVWQ